MYSYSKMDTDTEPKPKSTYNREKYSHTTQKRNTLTPHKNEGDFVCVCVLFIKQIRYNTQTQVSKVIYKLQCAIKHTYSSVV